MGSFAISVQLNFQSIKEGKGIPDAMLIALSTLCQLLSTKAMAGREGVSEEDTNSKVTQQTFGPIRKRRQLLFQGLHLRRRCRTEIAELLEILELGLLLVDPRSQSRRLAPGVSGERRLPHV